MISSPNLPPSWRSLGMGVAAMSPGTHSSVTMVCCAGLCMPDANLARILLCATPACGDHILSTPVVCSICPQSRPQERTLVMPVACAAFNLCVAEQKLSKVFKKIIVSSAGAVPDHIPL